MALQKRTIAIPLGGGVQDGIGPKLLDPPHLLDLRNARFNRRGEYEKRFGDDGIGAVGVPSDQVPCGLYHHGDALLQTGTTGLIAWDPLSTRWFTPNEAAPRPSILKTDPLARGNGSYRHGDVAYSANDALVGIAYEDETEAVVRVAWINVNTAERVRETRVAGTNGLEQPRLLYFDDRFVLFARDITNNNIVAAAMNPSAGSYAFGSWVTLHTGAGTDRCYDVTVSAGATEAHLVVGKGTGWDAYEVDSGPSLAGGTMSSIAGELHAIAVVHNPEQGRIHVVYDDQNPFPPVLNHIWYADSYTGSASATAKVLDYSWGTDGDRRCTAVLAANAGSLWCVVSHSRSNGGQRGGLEYVTIDKDGVAQGDQGFEPNLILATKATLDTHGRPVVGASREVSWNFDDTGPVDAEEPLPFGVLLTPQTYTITDASDGEGPGETSTFYGLAQIARFGHDRIWVRSPKADHDYLGTLVDVDDILWGAYSVIYETNPAGEGTSDAYGQTENRGWRWGVDFLRCEVDPLAPFSSDAEGLTLLSGGVLASFDGQRLVEANIPVVPVKPVPCPDTFVSNLVGASSTDYILIADEYNFTSESISDGYHLATIRYRYAFRWVDAEGNLHRSTVSPILSLDRQAQVNSTSKSIGGGSGASAFTAAGNYDNRNLLIPRPSFTAVNGEDGVRIQVELYRDSPHYKLYQTDAAGLNPTLVRDDINKGDDFLLVAVAELGEVTGYPNLGYITDIAAAPNVAPGAGARAPYDEGGELASEPPPAALDTVALQGRVFILDAEDRLAIRYSKPTVDGLAPEFNASQQMRVSSDGGEIVALAGLGDKLVALKERSVFATSVSGGPNANGAGTQFFAPRAIPSDAGCVNRVSVVSGPFGVAFQADRGIYLLDRGLALRFIGEPVKDEITSSTIITSAAVVPEENEVRWTLQGGVQLVWNYLLDQWTRSDNMVALHAVTWAGRHARLQTNGDARVDTPDSYGADGVTRPLLDVTTAWIKLAGLQGFQRVWTVMLLGEYDSGGLSVGVYYDYEDTVAHTEQFTATALAAAGSRMQVKIKPRRQRCQAIRFRVQETTGLLVGSGFKLQGLQLEVGVAPGGSYKHVGESMRS